MASGLEILGQRIALLRGRRSQREIAREAKLDVSTISRIERGVLDPTFTTLAAIARALGVTPSELAGDAPVDVRAGAAGDAKTPPDLPATLEEQLAEMRREYRAEIARVNQNWTTAVEALHQEMRAALSVPARRRQSGRSGQS